MFTGEFTGELFHVLLVLIITAIIGGEEVGIPFVFSSDIVVQVVLFFVSLHVVSF